MKELMSIFLMLLIYIAWMLVIVLVGSLIVNFFKRLVTGKKDGGE